MPAIVTINARKNADWNKGFQYRVGGAPQPLDGRLALMVRARASDPEAVLSLSSDSGGGITITDAAAGRFAVRFDRDNFRRMAAGAYVQDLIYTRADGEDIPIWEGALNLTEGVTR
jgi:hypothetical protein